MVKDSNLEKILLDLRELFKTDQIPSKDLKLFLDNVKSKEVTNYLIGLSKGSKPEQILREVFFTFNAVFAQHLFKEVFPEVSQSGGFIDYLIKEKREEISLEIKPLYVAEFRKEKTNKVLVRIKKQKLNPDDHKDQILKYLRGKRDYVVLTNLEEWYFFSKTALLDEDCKPFSHVDLFKLLLDFKIVKDFWNYIDAQEDLAVKEPLDEKFFESLKNWVSELSSVNFFVNNGTKTQLIINLINKFIFIHSLDSFWVISKNYIEEEWINIERKWTAKNKQRILKKYLEDINEYFYELYDTELFKIVEENKTIVDYIKQDQKNIELFYEKFKLILGVDYAKSPSGWIPGIIQYNFRRIDEDILGKSYETFLAEIRKEQGIFYTPNYVTLYIVDNAIGNFFDVQIEKFSQNLENEQYEDCQEILLDIFSFKIIDPACGSGSFLIKGLKIIWNKYSILNSLIENLYNEYSNFAGQVVRPKEIEERFQHILSLKKLLSFDDKRKLISKIIVRHIHGVDVDINAIEVAKLNLWLEAIKLAPKEFQFDRVPADTNHILPDLEMNLCNGDSLVGFSENDIKLLLVAKYKEDLKQLFELRNKYIEDPAKIEHVKEIIEIKSQIRKDLDDKFRIYLTDLELDQTLLDDTRPFHWILEFWFVYFDDSLEILIDEKTGFNFVIGNPPYFTIRGKGTGTLTQTYSYAYLQNADDWKEFFRSQSDIYYYFIMKSIQLLKNKGKFGFIIESYWLENDYADKLKDFILNSTSLDILINFGNVKKIFEDADNDTCILIFEKGIRKDNLLKNIFCKKNFSVGSHKQNNQKLMAHIRENIHKDTFSDENIDVFKIKQETLSVSKWVLSNKMQIIEKIESNKNLLGDLCDVGQGVVPGRKKEFKVSTKESQSSGGGYWISRDGNEFEVLNMKDSNEYTIELQFLKPLITNSGIKKFFIIPSDEYLIYTVPLQDGRESIEDFPGILEYLGVYEEELKDRYDYIEIGEDEEGEEKYPWYGYQRIQNIDLFEDTPIKILCPYRATENRFALDDKGYFGTTDMYAIVPKTDAIIDINYLLGLLNSRLLTFWYKEAGKSKGTILEFFATPLKKMPIFIGNKKEQEYLSKIVSDIIKFNKVIYEFKRIWSDISQKYRSGLISFYKLILGDKSKIQNGEFNKVWISNINEFPDEQKLDKEYNSYRVIIRDNAELQLLGVEDTKDVLLLEIETVQQEFRDIIYLEILLLMESRKKIKSLNDILSKTEISIIKPNIWEKTANLIKYAKALFEKWKIKNHLEFKIDDIIQTDALVQSLINTLDAFVFSLYSLSKNEAQTILDSLGTDKGNKREILKQLK